ncbi:putative odorant receptor 85e [Drosophila pseudoobscura]|uniref:Odorant receptor n=1 Tax=Drosophila pseudoobscura pseudoobscura TaxID=46245 RepID=A0A6I8V304_DROPS|nr:putative odorant receptor 85e [Drosophila pseudoobscura]
MASLQFHGNIDADTRYDATLDPAREPELFRLLMGLQLAMGMNPSPRLPSWWPTWLRPVGGLMAKAYCSMVILTSLHLGLLFTKTTLDVLPTGELQAITDALTMTIIYFFTAYANIYWCVRSQRLLAFMDHINREYRHHSLAGVTFVSSHAAHRWSRSFTTIWILSCLVGVITWGVSPLMLGIRTLPLTCWYPFDALSPGTYTAVYATQLFGQISVGVTFGFGGSLFVTLCLLLLAQFDVLFCSLKNLDAHSKLLSGETIAGLGLLQRELLQGAFTRELNQYAVLQEHATDLLRISAESQNLAQVKVFHSALVECVRLHRFILYCCAELENLFSPYCLVKSMQITLQLCLLVFVGVSGTREFLRIVNQIQYLALTLFELLMFTYCGELLSRHSVRSGEAFWRGGWWKHAHLLRQDVLIFLVNSRRAVYVTAGKFYVMDVNRLRSVITQAFSFLTLLQKLAAKKATMEA